MKINVLPLLLFGTVHTCVAQSMGNFTATGNLNGPRQNHTATLLTNGKVLIAGGFAIVSGWPVYASAELYDPSTGTFTATGNMTARRFDHTSTLLPDGKVLIAGGHRNVFPDGDDCSARNNYCTLGSAELYDPSTGAFTAVRNMTTARASHTATLLNNGKVLIAGGNATRNEAGNLASVELYDPSTGTFTAAGAMSAARAWHKATLLGNGKVLLDGGRREDDFDDRLNAELYDPDSGIFSLSGRTSYPGTFPATASLLMNGDVLDTLQYDSDPSVLAEVYDSSSGTFSATGQMNKSRGYGTSILLPDGKVFITGRDWLSYSGELYDPVKRTFSTTDGMVMPREASHTATLLPDGTILLAGGWICCGQSVDTAEIYHPVAPTPAPVLLARSPDGRGQGAILRAGTSQVVSADDPAAAGEILEIYCTGLTDGSTIPPQVAIGGRMAEVLWFGKAPGFATLNQVNVRVPGNIVAGSAVSVRLTYIGRPSNEVTIGVQ
jgi:hypothetical protein